jgi:phosphoribosylaminoimidazole carboxylase (NCAIR synthetase)
VSETFELKARELSEKIARALQLYGTFAVEMFEDENGGLFVNELAPRVHNSGHFSIDAAECSQFESHWRAILGMPLGSTRTAPAFAMQNLIAPGEAKSGNISQLGISSGAFHFHWYGKSEARAGRKMGHINLVSASANTLRVELKHLDALQREWLSKFERAS